jgi:hypothetical protein
MQPAQVSLSYFGYTYSKQSYRATLTLLSSGSSILELIFFIYLSIYCGSNPPSSNYASQASKLCGLTSVYRIKDQGQLFPVYCSTEPLKSNNVMYMSWLRTLAGPQDSA